MAFSKSAAHPRPLPTRRFEYEAGGEKEIYGVLRPRFEYEASGSQNPIPHRKIKTFKKAIDFGKTIDSKGFEAAAKSPSPCPLPKKREGGKSFFGAKVSNWRWTP